ncbi:MAG TPA: response regulator transcription factor [Solirubrobacteraceae bacterium]|jgi:DNA-binding NarL/FixJ family response regulator|nr:response regulator transcription factor [Solirubrobacteraceae bacterium]
MPTKRSADSDCTGTITVALVDPEPLIRIALARALEATGLELVGEAATGEDAVELVVDLHPDVVLTAMNLPGISGVETIEQIRRFAPTTRVLVLARSEHNHVVEAIIAGANGYVLKTASIEDIIGAVIATASGECVLSPEIAGKLVDQVRGGDAPVPVIGAAPASAIRSVLTARELEIFAMLASGESNPQIGRTLSLSAHTVANHIKSILAKLDLDNRVQAAVQAVRVGIA